MAKAQFWGGRFDKEVSDLMWDFSRGSCIDKYLLPYEIKSTIVHIKALNKAGIIDDKEKEDLLSALDKIQKQQNCPDYSQEDIHSFLQEQLRCYVGDLADKVHSFRSRNDLVAADSILMLKDWANIFISRIKQLQLSLLKTAERLQGIIVPSYTHLQQAQLVYFSHYLLSYLEAYDRVRRFFEWFVSEGLSLPLSACAGAGCSIYLDVKSMAEELGLGKVYDNSLDAIANRDYYLDMLYGLSKLAVISSRLCEDWIIYSSVEFGFLLLPEEFTTGSSIMPHKKNPDALELIRSRSAQVMSALFSLFMMLKALPLAYNRDLQEDKEITIPVLFKAEQILLVLSRLIEGIDIDKQRLSDLFSNDFLFATDLMEFLIKRGLSSRKAHKAVGELVKECEKKSISLKDLDINYVQQITGVDISEQDWRALFDPVVSVESKISYNGSCGKNVERQIKKWKAILEVD